VSRHHPIVSRLVSSRNSMVVSYASSEIPSAPRGRRSRLSEPEMYVRRVTSHATGLHVFSGVVRKIWTLSISMWTKSIRPESFVLLGRWRTRQTTCDSKTVHVHRSARFRMPYAAISIPASRRFQMVPKRGSASCLKLETPFRRLPESKRSRRRFISTPHPPDVAWKWAG
jgi:hypothetical protein